jgi:hypothetical protein
VGLGFAILGDSKLCAICDDPATWFCPVDDVCLCDDCDKQIHDVNFIARNHRRISMNSGETMRLGIPEALPEKLENAFVDSDGSQGPRTENQDPRTESSIHTAYSASGTEISHTVLETERDRVPDKRFVGQIQSGQGDFEPFPAKSVGMTGESLPRLGVWEMIESDISNSIPSLNEVNFDTVGRKIGLSLVRFR